MKPFPLIETNRLVLRGFTLTDAPAVHNFMRERDIPANTLSIPYPYPEGAAQQWISTHKDRFERGEGINLAVLLTSESSLVGAVGLVVHTENESAEMGYWIGKPYRGKGYCTEAVRALLRYGFADMRLNRIYAQHFARNPASGRVMQKAGMRYEGHLRQHVKKWDTFEDLIVYGTLKSEFASSLSSQ